VTNERLSAALSVGVTSGALLLVPGMSVYLPKLPFLFPSLGPLAFVFSIFPSSPTVHDTCSVRRIVNFIRLSRGCRRMLSLGQKLLALGIVIVMNLFVFVVSPLFGIITIFASLPFAFAIYNR